MSDIQDLDTPQMTVYTGYIEYDEDKDLVRILFPEFPELVIEFEKEVFTLPTITDRCTEMLSEEIRSLLKVNRTIPFPQNRLRDETCIDIYVDINKIKRQLKHLFIN